MTLPLMSTLDGTESELFLPSKIRTFWNSIAPALTGGLPCARTTDESPTPISGSAATKILRDIEFIQVPSWQTLQGLSQPFVGHTGYAGRLNEA